MVLEGRHFRYTSDKAKCPVKLGFITSCCKQVKCIYKAFVQIHCGISLVAPYGRQTKMKKMRVYMILFKKEGCCFALYRNGSPRVRFPCWYNSTVLNVLIPTFIELEVQLDMKKMKRHCCFFFLQRKLF